ncbi:hypothetical protein Fmac_009147 [Flemingia macrophylla]|uniref:Uncharacterized protein n=1 Tax=Flemingia macrophylla TaxID=520843 RepID=A0ABD1N098_9FABA
MHRRFGPRKLLLRRLRPIRVKPLRLPHQDHHQNLRNHAASQINTPSDLPSAQPPKPHTLLVSLHQRILHLPRRTTLPSHLLPRRSHLSRSHPPSNPPLQKSLRHALQILLPRLARVRRHLFPVLSHVPPPLRGGSVHDRPRPRPRREVFLRRRKEWGRHRERDDFGDGYQRD